MTRSPATIALPALFALLTGCATVTGSGSNQAISVQTYSPSGVELDGAKCDMTNDEGTWFVVTPGSTTIHRSNKDLQVICKKPGMDAGTASVVSRTKGNMFGNIILGGGIGAVIDHNNGTAYEYPSLVKIFMGRSNKRIDEKTEQNTLAANGGSVTPSNGTANPVATDGKQDASLDEARKKCEAIGFKAGTESFGNCVLKLVK